MKIFTVDPRDGGLGAGCVTCCCTPFSMRPNETDKVVINYAPWSVPIGGLGLVSGSTEIEILKDTSACSVAQINGFGPPNLGATGYTIFETPFNTALVIDVAVNGAFPTGNVFSYKKVPLTGPRNGSLTGGVTSVFNYTPNAGFRGYDEFYVEMTDAQGRKFVKLVGITVGTVVPPMIPSIDTGLMVDRTKIQVNPRLHQLTFPITMLPDSRECEVFKMSVRQQARDCDDLYSHISCYDVHVGKC